MVHLTFAMPSNTKQSHSWYVQIIANGLHFKMLVDLCCPLQLSFSMMYISDIDSTVSSISSGTILTNFNIAFCYQRHMDNDPSFHAILKF